MIPTPIRQVLSTIQTNGVQALLMGGQACVFYGAAQVSKDVDLVLLAEEENYARLRAALEQLNAKRIAVPRFDPALLARGHAVHFRCAAPGVEDLRIDIMTRLRDLPPFSVLWERRTVIAGDGGEEYHLLSIPDLVGPRLRPSSKPSDARSSRVPDWCAFISFRKQRQRLLSLERRFRGLTQQVGNRPGLPQRGQELLAVLALPEDILTLIPTVHGVKQGPGMLNAQLASATWAPRVSKPVENMTTSGTLHGQFHWQWQGSNLRAHRMLSSRMAVAE